MLSFRYRSYQKELLDGEDISFPAIRQNMAELNIINHLLGGHRITLKGLKSIIGREKSRPWRIAEIGCGGGDNLRVIQKWAAKHDIKVELTGIDINKDCIAYAQSVLPNTSIQFLVSDYRDVKFDRIPDVIFSSLFSHHFTNAVLIDQLKWMYSNSQKGFFINDLHRHPLAYYSIKTITRLFSRSYLVKNDAPLSVMRGFRQAEWQQLSKRAGLGGVSCQWQWAFRWLIVCKK
jgi:SAM-dependent methyltransferase